MYDFTAESENRFFTLENMEGDGGGTGLGGLAGVVPGVAGRGVLHQQLTHGVPARLCDGAHPWTWSQPRDLLKN